MPAPCEDIPRQVITGLILAGGRGQRLGGVDKGLLPLHGRPLVAHVLARLKPQVGAVVISANRHRERYTEMGCPVVSDALPDYPGPLAGIAAGLRVAVTPYLAVVPCDAPRLPLDLVERLYRALAGAQAEIAIAHDGRHVQPVFALIARTLLPDLLAYLEEGGRGVERWCQRKRLAIADFADEPEGFVNVNEPEEYARLEHEPDPTPPPQACGRTTDPAGRPAPETS
jgi:molybdopterin-guanine dinucleotide biosynthesis protein A